MTPISINKESDKFASDLSHMNDADFKRLFEANDKEAKERQTQQLRELKSEKWTLILKKESLIALPQTN